MKIGVLDDDITTLQLIEQALKGGENVLEDPVCRFFTRGLDMLAAVKSEAFDCLILDRQLPDMSCDVILQWIRQYGHAKFGCYTPVLLLTNLGTESDEVYGLQAGADDYLTKPFKPSVLVHRIHRLYTMNQMVRLMADKSNQKLSELPPTEVLDTEVDASFERYGYVFDAFKRIVVTPSGTAVPMTLIEFDLVCYLFKNAGVRLSRETILKQVWRNRPAVGRALDTHMHRVRSKLNLTTETGICLRTIYGFGYCLSLSGLVSHELLKG